MGKFEHALTLGGWAVHNSAGYVRCFEGSCAKVSKLSQSVFAALKMCTNLHATTFWQTFDILTGEVSMSLPNVPEIWHRIHVHRC